MAKSKAWGLARLSATYAVLLMACGSMAFAAEQGPLTLTLTGQTKIRGDIRVDTPEKIPVVKDLLKGGDAVFTNFEVTVYDPAKGQNPVRGYVSPPSSMEAVHSLGVNLLSLANNHSYDFQDAGILNALETADRLKLLRAGTGRTLSEADAPVYLNTPKGKVGFIALASGFVGRASATSPGANGLMVDEDANKPEAADAERILRRVREARQNSDIVLISQHNHVYPGVVKGIPKGGNNFSPIIQLELPERLFPPPFLVAWAHQLVDAGADVVALHGIPLLNGIEIYKGKPIFYSLGNFIFQPPSSNLALEEPIMWESVVAEVDFSKDRKLQVIRLQPIVMNKVGKGLPNPHDGNVVTEYMRTRGLPAPAKGRQAQSILARLSQMSAPYQTQFVITGDTATIKVPGAR